MKVLITGGAGFLGRHLTRAFCDAGGAVHVVDLVDPAERLDGVRYETADISEWFRVTNRRYDVILHLAASIGGRRGIERSPFRVAGNTGTDAAMFDFSVRTGTRRVVYMSSSAIYPAEWQQRHHVTPLREVDVSAAEPTVAAPDRSYGWSKLLGEYMAVLATENFNLPVTIYRPFTVYGPGQSDDYPLTAIAQRVLRGDTPVTVWGRGTQCRDLVYVDDFVRVVMETYEDGDVYSPLNIASGVGTNFLEIARTAMDIMGHDAEVCPQTTEPEGAVCRIGSPDGLPVGLRPRTTPREGLERLLESLCRVSDAAVL